MSFSHPSCNRQPEMMGVPSRHASSLRTKIVVSFFIAILVFGICMSVAVQSTLKSQLEAHQLEAAVVAAVVRNVNVITLGLIIAVMVLTLFIAIILSQRISVRIKTLTDSVQHIMNGDMDIRIDPQLMQSNDEIAVLAVSFANMTNNLRLSYHKLQEKRTQAETACQEAESANKAKSQFLANMSHEIRTPLNAIMGFSEVIAHADSLEKTRELSTTVIRESDHLLSIIDPILDHAKIESGSIELEIQPLNLHELLQSVISPINVLAQPKGLLLLLDQQPGVPMAINGDVVRLRQVLINLLNNAVKFTDRGSVTLRVETQASAQENNLRFAVIDTGIGIPADKHELIFETFTQADGSTTREYGGTGLGTVISRELVELMGGQMGLESEPGKGSTFWFTIPLRVAEAPADQSELLSGEPDGEITASPSLTVLVVEDYEPNQAVARLHLERAGHRVDIAANGEEALAACLRKRYDIIFMDIQMPVLDGYGATRRILSECELNRRTPIVGLTANTDQATHRLCEEVGMVAKITKPIRGNTLLQAIKDYRLCAGRSSTPKGECSTPTAKKPQTESVANADVATDMPAAPLDMEGLLEDHCGDIPLIHALVNQFLALLPDQIRTMKQALALCDPEPLAQEAHRIRGAAGNIRATTLFETATALEAQAKRQAFMEAEKTLGDLEEAVRYLTEYVPCLSEFQETLRH